MKKQTRSILHELNSMIVERDRKHVMESRATNVIESAINLINEMHNKGLDAETTEALHRSMQQEGAFVRKLIEEKSERINQR